MKNSKSNDVLAALTIFQQKVLKNKPTIQEMWKDVRMMKFRIRPLEGDLSRIDFQNKEFIEALWSLGKFDDFFQREYPKLKNDQKRIFFHLFDNLHQRFQTQLRNAGLKNDSPAGHSETVEMEIFKERLTEN